MKTFLTIILFSILTMAPQAFAETSNRVAAFVNDDVITLYELNNKIEELTGKSCEELREDNEQQFFMLRGEVLDLLIETKLADAKIKELGLEASKDDIDEYIEYRKKRLKMTQEDLIEQLKSDGISFETFYKRMKDDLEHSNLIDSEIRSKIVITESKLLDYYEQHKMDYEKPGKVHIAGIFLTTDSPGSKDIDSLREKGKEILERLKKGEDFGSLAKEFSGGPGAEDGGDLGNIPTSQIDPEMLDVIKRLEKDDVSTLINRGSSIQIIKLINRTETGATPFEEMRDEIYQALYSGEIEKRYQVWVKDLKANCYLKKIF